MTGVVIALVAVFAWAFPAFAGIPEPGILMYGQVLDDNGDLVTAGTLTWSFEADDAETPPVVIHTELDEISGVGGPYSYRVVVPFESAVEDSPVDTGVIPLSETPLDYTRTAQIVDTTISMSHAVSLSKDNRGTVLRVDVCAECAPEGRTFHSADVNEDLKFSLNEFLRVYEFYVATDNHEYHIDPNGEDGFGIGTGKRDGVAHSGDFEGGADWRFSMTEMVRMVDLFASTPQHRYGHDARSADGFKKDTGRHSEVSERQGPSGTPEGVPQHYRRYRPPTEKSVRGESLYC
jgi:hypothetical protein